MLLRATFIFLFASLTFAANWQYEIYVNSSFGVNSTSCWNRKDQTCCATLNLALQGLQYNSTVIYLYPGTYILDNTSKVIYKYNIAIVGLTTKDGGKTITIKCSSHSGLLFLSSTNITLVSLVLDSCGNIQINPNREFDFQMSAVYISMCYNVQLIDIVKLVIESGNNSTGLNQYSSNEYGNTLDIANEMLECPYLKLKMSPCYYYNYNLDNNIIFSGVPFYICASIYDCNNETFYWRYNLKACVVSGPASFYSNLQCDTIYYDCSTDDFMITLFNNNVINSSEVIISIQTKLSIVQTLESNLSLIVKYKYTDCTYSRLGKCSHGYGIPINQLDKCVQCDQHPAIPGWVMFFLIQLLPLTIVVLIIIVFNIQLTNGFMIGVVFYCQMISVVYPNLSLNVVFENYFNYDCSINDIKWYIIPCNIFNLDFLPFLSHPLCVTSNMTPLQAILFWYIIPTYPLVLLLLIYIWITMYDKGFRCVVTITRPLHRLLARFWRKTNIEPSFIHSIASIYLLCFTQFAATSLQLLYPTTWYYENENSMTHVTFYNINYFGWPHSFAGTFAIIVLVFIIFLPMLYIQLYPFKLFHKLLSCLHLRKEILISLSDIFTGLYKNGSDNTRDYRCFAGFYFVLRIIVLCLHILDDYFGQIIVLCCQIALFALFGGMIMIFRPYKNNLQNFSNLIIFLLLMATNAITLIQWVTGTNNQPADASRGLIVTFSVILIFLIFISVVVWTVKKIASICVYCSSSSNPSLIEEHANIQPLLENDDNWIADRMEHPDRYDEQHVQHAPYDIPVSQLQDITGHATYGSTINTIRTDNSEVN